MNTEKEIWKDVVGYEGLYMVSNKGAVSFMKDGDIGICKHYLNNGYPKVWLSKNGVSKFVSVHRIVATAFIPNTENKRTVNHKNGIKVDNNLENLEWATHEENARHAHSIGLYTNQKKGYSGTHARWWPLRNRGDIINMVAKYKEDTGSTISTASISMALKSGKCSKRISNIIESFYSEKMETIKQYL
ncbi:MAG: HNH endonuclease [Pyrinomonadaceae bacterium]|nr:HNH endonuclease [Sphingobacteriaceae bacterium]